MRARNTIEYLGVWEKLHNPNFNSIEFDAFRNQSGLHSFSLTPTGADMLNLALFGYTAKDWEEANPELAKKLNMRDTASINELVVNGNLITHYCHRLWQNCSWYHGDIIVILLTSVHPVRIRLCFLFIRRLRMVGVVIYCSISLTRICMSGRARP